MPSEATLRRRARVDSGFRAALADIVRKQTEARIASCFIAKRKRQKLPSIRTPKRSPAKDFEAALSRDQLYATVAAAVPKTLPPIMRDDIICDIMLAVLEGQIAVAEIKGKAKDFVREHWRMFGTLRDLSLDATMFDDSAATIGDRVAGHGADYW